LIVQKSDGGFGYAATDLAGARYRVRELGATRLVYVVDARQSEHFAMVFSVLRKSGWAPPQVSLEHVAFGTILGADRKPFATRQGGTVRLMEVLSEAVDRARAVLDQKNSELSEAERQRVAEAVGIGAVKYADLSSERVKDYTFDYARMLALEGNTSPYLQNAFVRIQSIFRKGGVDQSGLSSAALKVNEPARAGDALVSAPSCAGGGGQQLGAAPPVQLLVRAGGELPHVLRALPRAQRRARAEAEPPRAV
jgi:arginyl-tRNA synthetase